MAITTIGGSTGIPNQKKTPNAIQKKAFSESEDQQIKNMSLATSYAQKPTLLDSRISLADWYRNGTSGLITREAKAVEPLLDDTAAFHVFGTPLPNTKAPKGSDSKQKKGDVELVPKYTKFILENMSEGHAERSQISETFGSFYVFFFGERPPIYNYSGTLINAKDINWRADFQFYYDNYLRGTKCVERNARLVMTYGGRQVEGFMLNFQTTTDAAVEMGVKVTFQILITDRLSVLGLSQDFGTFDQSGAQSTDEAFTKMLNDIAGKEGNGLSSQAASVAYNEVSATLNGNNAAGPMINGGSLTSVSDIA